MKCIASRRLRIAVITVAATVSIASIAAQGQTRSTQSPSKPTTNMKLQPLNIKTGLWETTITSTIGGAPPVSPEMLAKLKPEQRARLEARMQAGFAGNSRTNTDQSCVTAKDLDDPDFGVEKGCTRTILSSTSTHANGTISCEIEGMSANGTLDVEAVDQGHIKGWSHGTATGGGRTMKVDTTFSSKWLGSSCGDKSRD